MAIKKTAKYRQYETQVSDDDLEAIRQVTGNDELAEDEVIIFPPFVIAKSGPTYNQSEISADALKASTWTGIPMLFRDHESTASNVFGKIYKSWTTDVDGQTVLYGMGFAIKSDDQQGIIDRVKNRIVSDMSCAYMAIESQCSVCGEPIDEQTGLCPNGHNTAVDTKIEPEHLSMVGPGMSAIPGSGLVSASKICHSIRQYMREGTKPEGISDIDLEGIADIRSEWSEYRQQCKREFSKYYRVNNANTTDEAIERLCSKLSCTEMISLAKIQREKCLLPDGKQISTYSREDDDLDLDVPEFKSIREAYSNRQKKTFNFNH